MSIPLKISLLGRVEIQQDGQTLSAMITRRVEALLIYLICNREPQSREVLVTLFWPDHPQKQARRNFNNTLYRLKQLIGDTVVSNRQTVTLSQTFWEGEIWVDYVELHHHLTLTNQSGHLTVQQAQALADALSHYQGDFLAGFFIPDMINFDDWASVERERLHQQVVEGLHRLVAHYLRAEDYEAGIFWSERLLGLEALDETGHEQMMRLLALNGQRNMALAHFERYTALLDNEMGSLPTEEATALVEQIQKGILINQETTPNRAEIQPTFVQQPTLSVESDIPPILDPIRILNRLTPMPDQELFGIDTAQATLVDQIYRPKRPWLVALDGIGGIGKTTLAHRIVIDLTEKVGQETTFVDVAWVSAKQTFFSPDLGLQETDKPALDVESLTDQLLGQLLDGTILPATAQEKRLTLLRRLKETPTLIIIDNLETIADHQTLLPFLRQVVNPSKVMLTTRHSLKAHSDVYCLSLDELSEADALALLRHEVALSGSPLMTNASDSQLGRIYEVVGGNPLALKMVLGQINFLSLSEVLDSLIQAKGQQVDDLYTYIYWQAWQMLDEPTRTLFVALPICPDGTLADLERLTNLSRAQLQQSLKQLISLSLVTVGGDLEQPRYRLHRLTETFLMNEVLKWQESNPPESIPDTETKHYLTLFETHITRVVQHWHNHAAIEAVDVAVLEPAQESILKSISLAFSLSDLWPTLGTLIIGFSPYMERRGLWGEWNPVLLQAISTAQQRNDVDGEITLSALLARLYQRQSKPKDVIRHYRRVIRLARKAENRYELARACSNLGYAYIDEGRWWRSEVLCCQALEIFEDLDSDHGRAHTHNHLGVLYTKKNVWIKAENHLNEACRFWQRMDDSFGLIYGLDNKGLLYMNMELPQKAIEHLEQALLIAQQTQIETEISKIWNNLGRANQKADHFSKAEDYLKKAEKTFRKNANHLDLARVWHNLGWLYFNMNKWLDAEAYFTEALKAYQNLENSHEEIIIIEDLIMCETSRQNWSKASRHLKYLEQINQHSKRSIQRAAYFRKEIELGDTRI
ncbi:MAG: tetratricopeptide repeat protein [Chloroflexota bacterium]